MNIVLVGGSGFLGQYIVNELVANGHRCTVLCRNIQRCRSLRLKPSTRLVQADVYDEAQLAEHFEGADAVISMAGILNESGSDGRGFNKVHVELPNLLADVCTRVGISRFMQISALNAGKGESLYLESKGEAEKLLLAKSGLDTTIFQPSVIFGPGDSFFNRFAGLLKFAPVMPLACGNSRMQPVYAGDVARAVAASLGDPSTYGKTFELGGPEIYSLSELVKFTASTMGRKRWVITLPDWLSRMQGMVLGLIPGKPFSMDNYRSLQTDNITSRNGFRYFGIVPRSIESTVPGYLGVSVHQKRLTAIRKRARR